MARRGTPQFYNYMLPRRNNRIGRQAGVERLHPHLLQHAFACLYLMRYRDPFALKSLLGHTTLQMTYHYCEAVQQMDAVRAGTTTIVDGIDTTLLEINRRGRLKYKHAGRMGGRSSCPRSSSSSGSVRRRLNWPSDCQTARTGDLAVLDGGESNSAPPVR